MAKEVHGSHLSAFQWNILANVFVAVDMITVYIMNQSIRKMKKDFDVENKEHKFRNGF